MAHSRTCPHNCEACKSPWHAEAWWSGDCIVCAGFRGVNSLACDVCWNSLSKEEQNAAQKFSIEVASSKLRRAGAGQEVDRHKKKPWEKAPWE